MNDSAPPRLGGLPIGGVNDEQSQWARLARECRYRREPLARLLQVCQRTLDRYFKKHLSLSVGSWLRELQLNDAYQQIIAGRTLKEAAFEVGFKQASHFSRSFKGRFGILPSVLRGTPRDVLRGRLEAAANGLLSRSEPLLGYPEGSSAQGLAADAVQAFGG